MKKTALIFTLSISLLTACSDTGGESAPPSNISQEVLSASSESAPQMSEPSAEIEPAETNTCETLTETEESNVIVYPSTEHLLYNGKQYGLLVGSRPTKVDGKLYELSENEIIEPFIDAECMKEECEYIGQSIPICIDLYPEHELELAACYDFPCELYKIDENLILVYCTEDYPVSESYIDTMFYPGTYRIHLILENGLDSQAQRDMFAKYYRYAERFPEQYS